MKLTAGTFHCIPAFKPQQNFWHIPHILSAASSIIHCKAPKKPTNNKITSYSSSATCCPLVYYCHLFWFHQIVCAVHDPGKKIHTRRVYSSVKLFRLQALTHTGIEKMNFFDRQFPFGTTKPHKHSGQRNRQRTNLRGWHKLVHPLGKGRPLAMLLHFHGHHALENLWSQN